MFVKQIGPNTDRDFTIAFRLAFKLACRTSLQVL